MNLWNAYRSFVSSVTNYHHAACHTQTGKTYATEWDFERAEE